MRCPFSCNAHGTMTSCAEYNCALTDNAGNCLIKQALQCYIDAAKEKANFTRAYICEPYPPKEGVKLKSPRIEVGYVP